MDLSRAKNTPTGARRYLPGCEGVRRLRHSGKYDTMNNMSAKTDRLTADAAKLNAWYAGRHGSEARTQPVAVPAVARKCARCGHAWQTEADAPTPGACPKCKARKWQTPPPLRISDTRRDCKVCGHTWKARKPTRPGSCPRCNSPYWDAPEAAKRALRTAKNLNGSKMGENGNAKAHENAQ